MKQMILGGLIALALAAVGFVWWQGRAEVEEAAPPPAPITEAETGEDPDALPEADIAGMVGPAPPVATELSKEQRRFFRYDRNRDQKITRNEMLSTRTSGFRKLDKDGNNLLTFEEWAVTTADKFDGADANGDRALSQAEFATTAPKPRKTSSCSC